MEIRKSFPLKSFFVILGVSLIPLLIIFFYLNKIDSYFGSSSLLAIFIILFLLAIVLALMGALFVSKPIYNRLVRYNEFARKIAGGKFEHRIPVETDDELGKLGKFFNILTKEHHEIKKKGVSEKLFEGEKIQAIIKNIGDGVIVTDNSNRIVLLNSVANKWFEKKLNGYSGQKIDELIQEKVLLDLINNVKGGLKSEDLKVEIKIKPAKGTKEIILQAIATRVVGENNNLMGVATALRDLTKEKEVDRMKTELVSMVAHELRSPLTSIAGFSELLLDEEINQEQSNEYAEIILSESRRLSELINKFLDISRIESGKNQIQKTAVNMGDVIRGILGMNIYLAESKGISVELGIPDIIDDVFVDRELMGEVILNLFSNAVKYSPAGKKVKIYLEDKNDEQIIKVIDQGFGISEDSQTKIFNKFYRVTDNEKIRDINGSGLGLSLVKEIIEQHSGTIRAESKLNEGSTFIITLSKNDNIKSEFNDEQITENYLIE